MRVVHAMVHLRTEMKACSTSGFDAARTMSRDKTAMVPSQIFSTTASLRLLYQPILMLARTRKCIVTHCTHRPSPVSSIYPWPPSAAIHSSIAALALSAAKPLIAGVKSLSLNSSSWVADPHSVFPNNITAPKTRCAKALYVR